MNRFCFAFLFAFCGIIVNARAANLQCLANIGADDAAFITPMYNNVLSGMPPEQQNIDANKTKMFNLVAANIYASCLNGGNNLLDFNKIAESSQFLIPFTYKNNEKYVLNVDTEKLFDYINIPMGFLVMNDRTKTPGDIVKKTDMPNDYFFDSDCSDHWVRANLSDDAAVNVAGQAAFGNKNEYFLDFPVGKSCRAFPGLVLGDLGGWGGKEKIISYSNYLSARKALTSFSGALQNTACSGGGQNLAVYLVALNVLPANLSDVQSAPSEKSGNSGWVIGGGIGAAGSTAAAIFIGSNPVGWIIGAVGAAGAAVAGTLIPKDLANIDQVLILSEPEIIR